MRDAIQRTARDPDMTLSASQTNPYASYPPPPAVPLFEVTVMTHAGAVFFWFSQRRTVRGTYAQCEAAIRSAQNQNLLVGWWSVLSLLIFNWIALSHNSSERKRLHQQAQQAAEYAQWWYTYVGLRTV
ncbi:hypothetical protein FK535_27375 [Mycolicibacterium sp. 018/SC-01/001]|uniref:hypothetical protein n=1 Tax=Mycolicibacterium sp. 018/SC-01/001 TaxID=2592069 RepID=UPI0011807592|nr:hypothetical protein [Mycolicibacterium sp. 018/SC-01/001]TRW76977.1 hypothetical protein FK535_27375 [Mycolicibacterium sp. 018/SC-01/001]